MLHIIWAISNGFKSMLHKKINTWSVLFSVETISSQLFNDLNPKNLLDWDILSCRWSVTYPLFEIDRTRYKSTLNIRKLWLFCFYNERQKHENMIRWPRTTAYLKTGGLLHDNWNSFHSRTFEQSRHRIQHNKKLSHHLSLTWIFGFSFR